MLLIVGRTCVGKDTLTNALIKKGGLKMLKSYTTRPKRYESENTHIFINPALAGYIVDKVATTRINEYEYFATKDQLINNDIYIIDPYGIKTLLTHCPDISFQIIHVTAPKTLSKQKAINRSNNPDESTVFEKRYESENRQFSEFEKISEKIMPCKIGPLPRSVGFLRYIARFPHNPALSESHDHEMTSETVFCSDIRHLCISL